VPATFTQNLVRSLGNDPAVDHPERSHTKISRRKVRDAIAASLENARRLGLGQKSNSELWPEAVSVMKYHLKRGARHAPVNTAHHDNWWWVIGTAPPTISPPGREAHRASGREQLRPGPPGASGRVRHQFGTEINVPVHESRGCWIDSKTRSARISTFAGAGTFRLDKRAGLRIRNSVACSRTGVHTAGFRA
jgi:hypothetical protein